MQTGSQGAFCMRRVPLCRYDRNTLEITPMKDMPSRVAEAMYHQIQNRGFTAPADVLIDVGVLDKKKYDDWGRTKHCIT